MTLNLPRFADCAEERTILQLRRTYPRIDARWSGLNFGMQKYTHIPVPVPAISACPHNWDRVPDSDASRKAAWIRDDEARCTEWADVFRRGVPAARIVTIPNADHYVYLSHQVQVAAEMNVFFASLH